MSKTQKFAAGIVVVAIAVFGALLLADPAWARPSCAACNFNFGNCMAGCTTPGCEDNCWGWYDICLNSCVGGAPYDSCITNCDWGMCELQERNGYWIWYCNYIGG